MQRKYSSTFPTGAAGGVMKNCCVSDFAEYGISNGIVRTPGAYLITTMPLQPPSLTAWSITTIAVQGLLTMLEEDGGAPQSWCGQLGRIVAGLTEQGPTTGSGVVFTVSAPWNAGNQPAFDPTLIGSLWDPAVDPMPPWTHYQVPTPSTVMYLPVTCVITPPQPVKLTAGAQINIGVWIQPSIMLTQSGVSGDAGLSLFNGSYTVNYDDGL